MRRNKYNVSSRLLRTYNGIVFDSKREMYRYIRLELLEKEGEIKNLRRQVKFELSPKYINGLGENVRSIDYIADFVYEDKNGKVIIEDTKGYRTPEYKLKRKLFERLYYPHIIQET